MRIGHCIGRPDPSILSCWTAQTGTASGFGSYSPNPSVNQSIKTGSCSQKPPHPIMAPAQVICGQRFSLALRKLETLGDYMSKRILAVRAGDLLKTYFHWSSQVLFFSYEELFSFCFGQASRLWFRLRWFVISVAAWCWEGRTERLDYISSGRWL